MVFLVYRDLIPSIELHPCGLIHRIAKVELPYSFEWEYYQAWYKRVTLLVETTKKWFLTENVIQTRHHSTLYNKEKVESM